MCIFKVHIVSQWPNLRHLAEPLRGAVGLLEAVSFKKATSNCSSSSSSSRCCCFCCIGVPI